MGLSRRDTTDRPTSQPWTAIGTPPPRARREEARSVGRKTCQLYPPVILVCAARNGEACEEPAAPQAGGQSRGKPPLRQEPLLVGKSVDVNGERPAVGGDEVRRDHDAGRGIRGVLDIRHVAVYPYAERIDAWRNGHRRRRPKLKRRSAAAHSAIPDAHDAVAEEHMLARRRDGAGRADVPAGPSVSRHERQQHGPVVGHSVRPVEFIRSQASRCAAKARGYRNRNQQPSARRSAMHDRIHRCTSPKRPGQDPSARRNFRNRRRAHPPPHRGRRPSGAWRAGPTGRHRASRRPPLARSECDAGRSAGA